MRFERKRWRMGVLIVVNVILVLALALPTGAFAAPAPGSVPGVAEGDAPGEVRLLRSDAEGVTLALDMPELTLAAAQASASAGADNGCQQVQAAGFVQTEETGRPQLPVKVVLLGVPPNAELALDVSASPTRGVASGVTLCTAPPVPAAEGTEGSVAAADAAAALAPEVYGVDAFYPSETVRLIDLGFMRSQRIVRVEIYPVQFNPVSLELRASDRIELAVRFAEPAGLSAAGPVVEPAEFEAAFRRTLLNYETARAWRDTAGLAAEAAAPAWTPPQPGYKVSVRAEGLYQLTRTALAAAGLPVDQLNPRTLRMFNAGQEVALRVIGEEDGKLDAQDVVLFFGQGADTRYTDTNVYWLTYGGALGLRMSTRNSVAGGRAVSSFFASVKREDNLVYDTDLPMLTGYDHWWGQTITAVGAVTPATLNLSAATPLLATDVVSATVSLQLGGVTTGSHHVRLYVNPASHPAAIWNGAWDGMTVHLISAAFPQSYLNSTGNNTIRIELINDTAGRPADIVRVDWLKVGYQRKFATTTDRLFFGGDNPGAHRYNVEGFSSADIELYDVTDPVRITRINWAVEDPAAFSRFLPLVLNRKAGVAAAGDAAPAAPAASTLSFGDMQITPRRYLAQVPAQRLSPLSIVLDQASNLQTSSAAADYIIISHADFLAAVQPLAALRTSQGLRVRVVDVQDIYDEFGGGLMSAEAIRDFVAYAYTYWTKPAPKSVLLVGDGTYDFRQYTSAASTFVPPYLELVDPDAGETVADNRFVAVTPGDILPDLDIGRLPANTPAEATAMVTKILGYEAQAPASWMKQVVFVADDLEGGGGNFYDYSDSLADGSTTYRGSTVKILPAAYTPNKIYLGQTCDLSNPVTSVECRAQIINKINAGSLMVSYIGHGLKTNWAVEYLYDASALASVANPDRLAIMLPMTCNEGYFIDPTEASLSELGVRAAGKGAIASWAPTGYGLAPGHDYLERGVFLAVFHDDVALGSGATMAKLYLIANAPTGKYLDLIDTFLLLGDPALRVP